MSSLTIFGLGDDSDIICPLQKLSDAGSNYRMIVGEENSNRRFLFIHQINLPDLIQVMIGLYTNP